MTSRPIILLQTEPLVSLSFCFYSTLQYDNSSISFYSFISLRPSISHFSSIPPCSSIPFFSSISNHSSFSNYSLIFRKYMRIFPSYHLPRTYGTDNIVLFFQHCSIHYKLYFTLFYTYCTTQIQEYQNGRAVQVKFRCRKIV